MRSSSIAFTCPFGSLFHLPAERAICDHRMVDKATYEYVRTKFRGNHPFLSSTAPFRGTFSSSRSRLSEPLRRSIGAPAGKVIPFPVAAPRVERGETRGRVGGGGIKRRLPHVKMRENKCRYSTHVCKHAGHTRTNVRHLVDPSSRAGAGRREDATYRGLTRGYWRNR